MLFAIFGAKIGLRLVSILFLLLAFLPLVPTAARAAAQ
jgi:hypothetical protein